MTTNDNNSNRARIIEIIRELESLRAKFEELKSTLHFLHKSGEMQNRFQTEAINNIFKIEYERIFKIHATTLKQMNIQIPNRLPPLILNWDANWSAEMFQKSPEDNASSPAVKIHFRKGH